MRLLFPGQRLNPSGLELFKGLISVLNRIHCGAQIALLVSFPSQLVALSPNRTDGLVLVNLELCSTCGITTKESFEER